MSGANGTSHASSVPVRLRGLTRYATNPLLDTTEVRSKRKTTRALSRGSLIASQTGESVSDTALYSTKEVDEATFVKVFDAGIQAAFDLTGPAFKVFQLVLRLVASGRMQGDQILMHVSLATDPTSPLKMSDKTFWRGMKELVEKRFIAAGTIPGSYWINPHLFFKGDRLLIVNEYIKQKALAKQKQPERPEIHELQPGLF
jgi:Firmicute plasmid replication protein (RepL)